MYPGNRRRVARALCAVLLCLIPLGSAAGDKGKKPKLALRASPRMAASPVSIVFTAELQGGDDSEDFHCPALVWDWDDGTTSTHESDCEPFDPATPIERRYTAQHRYEHEGSYDVKVAMKRAERVIASTRVLVTIRPGLADLSRMD